VSADLGRLAAGELWLPTEPAAPVAFAAEELRRYLARLFGAAPACRTAAGPRGHWLCLLPPGAPLPVAALAPQAGAEHVVRPADGALALAGATPRDLLAATYALLAAAGCRWSPGGGAEEHVPARGAARREAPAIEARPAFVRRAWAADLASFHYTLPERLAERLPGDLAFVDWMAKSGATGFLFIRHANDTCWFVPEVAPALAARGLELEGGGHVLAELLPRDLFAAHPEFFPLGPGGQRSDLGNACGSSPGALATIAARARAALSALPGATGLHLWGLDLLGGGWCACPGCAPLGASDQALRVCNAAAETLDADARILHLAYHDTLAPPRRVRPHPRVWAEFAPRERCWAHAIDDDGCATNRAHRDLLARHVDLFEGRVEVFEYYADAILFGGCAVPLGEVIARDLGCYAGAGVRGVSCLTFGAYSLLAYGANVEAFARGAHDPAAARGAAAHHARHVGPAAEPVARYLAALERLVRPALGDGDLLLPPRRGPRATVALAGFDAALAAAPEVRSLLAAAAGPAPAARRAAEQQLLDYTLGALSTVRTWLAAVLAGHPTDTGADRALAALADAARPLVALDPALVGTWGRYDLALTHHFFAAAMGAPTDPREDLPAPVG
jgi:hypothetical protein